MRSVFSAVGWSLHQDTLGPLEPSGPFDHGAGECSGWQHCWNGGENGWPGLQSEKYVTALPSRDLTNHEREP